MARISTRFVSWKVFFDGVEIPWLAFNISVGVDSPGGGSVTIEPDPMLTEIRVGTVVEIFMYDDMETGSDEDKYKFFWKGEIAGTFIGKEASSRSCSVSVEGDLSLFGRSKLFAHGIGPIGSTPHVSGSYLSSEVGLQGDQLFNYAMFAKALGTDKADTPVAQGASGVPPAYADRLMGLFAYLSGYNGLFRLQAVRSRLFSRMATIQDRTMDRLIPRSMIADYVQQTVSQSLGPGTTMLDLLGLFNAVAYHHFVSVLGPKYVDGGKPDPIFIAGSTSDNLYAMGRPYIRNDYIFMPEMYYAVPPSCNFIFPEHFQNLGVARSFYDEPTRALIRDEYIGGSLIVPAPDDIIRYANEPFSDPAVFWSMNRDGMVVEGKTKSPYQSMTGEKSYSMFAAVSDSELEKGIIPIVRVPPFEYFSAVSNLYDASKESAEALAALIKPFEKMCSGDIKDLAGKEGYVYLMKALADYQLNLAKFRRSVSITLVGHRWLVPGLPCVLFDTMASYIGYVKSVALSVTSEGAETSSVGLDYVRTIPRFVKDTDDKDAAARQGNLDAAIALDSATARTASKIKDTQAATHAAGINIAQSLRSNAAVHKDAIDLLVTNFQVVYDVLKDDKATLGSYGVTSAQMATYMNTLRLLSSGASQAAGADAFGSFDSGIVDACVTLMDRYYDDMIKGVEKAGSALDVAAMPAGVPDGLSRNLIQAINKASSYVLEYTEFFKPPVFGNFDFLSAKKAEEIYVNLIGSIPALTGRVSETQDFSVGSEAATGVAALRVGAYYKYKALIDELKKIFPIGGMGGGTTEWEQASERGDNAESVRDWADRKYLRRTGLQSLRSYADKHGLRITTRDSLPPTPQPFMVMVPVDTEEVGDLTWDDTQYSKVVDEFKIAPRKYTIIGASGQPETVSEGTPDVEIARLRESSKQPYLTTLERQKFWISYAENHFGSRAFTD